MCQILIETLVLTPVTQHHSTLQYEDKNSAIDRFFPMVIDKSLIGFDVSVRILFLGLCPLHEDCPHCVQGRYQ
jgi:hypothetical protein